ncbi:hypothetical protein [Streptomyces radiopugnans]|uniref:hypothetical protein n=1 Tax=Streptomyces radiopugnans TaxID=403935 RepID=UPI003F1BE413
MSKVAGMEERRNGRHRNLRKACAAILLTGGVAAAVAGAATAYTAHRDPSDRIVEHRVPEEERERAREYWTEERIRNADPAGPLGIEPD